MANVFFKDPFEVLRIAANCELMADTQDIQCKQADTILKWIQKTSKREGKDVRQFSTTTEAREILLDEIRNGNVTKDHPVFRDWPKPKTAGLITALNRANLISQSGCLKKVFKTNVDPVTIWEENEKVLADKLFAEKVLEDKLLAEKLLAAKNTESLSMESGSQLQPSQRSVSHSQTSQLSVLPVLTNQSPLAKTSSRSQHSLTKKTPRPRDVPPNMTTSDFEKFSDSICNTLNAKMADQLKAVHELFVTSSAKFTSELQQKASQNYVRENINTLENKVNELEVKVMDKFDTLPTLKYQNSNSPVASENSDNIRKIMARLDSQQKKIELLEEQVFPEITAAFIATQLDLYQLSRIDFRNAVNGQKRAGLIYITVPSKFFTIRDNKAEIHADAVAEVLGINFYFKSKTTTNKDKTNASIKIQVTSQKKGQDAFSMVDEVLGRRREIQQNQGILLKTSIIQKFHFLHVLRHWIATKIIFSFENTLGGQYRLFIGDGIDSLTTAKKRNESCSSLLVDCPGMLFKLKNPSVEALMKIRSGKFFPADNGQVYPVPEDKLWIFEYQKNDENQNTRNSISENGHHNQTATHANANPAILQTRPLSEVASQVNAHRPQTVSTPVNNGLQAVNNHQVFTNNKLIPAILSPPQQQSQTAMYQQQSQTAMYQSPQNQTQNPLVAQLVEALKATNFHNTNQEMPVQMLSQALAQVPAHVPMQMPTQIPRS